MKVIILASGVGKRLKPLTDNIPKSLLELNGETIIEKQINAFIENNVTDFIITTGPFKEKITGFLQERYSDIDFTFVFNPKFDKTNYIYSLWLTKKHIDSDVFLIHGDVVFNKNLISKMLNRKENLVLVNKEIKRPEKDFKAIIEDDKVKGIGVNFFSDNAFFSLPFYKFFIDDFFVWMNAIEKEVNAGNLDIYAEDAFNKISDKLVLKPLYFTDESCMEIDTIDDLNKAKSFY